MKRFVEAVKNMFRIQDLRNRVLFTLALLAVYRIGAYIPIPGIQFRRAGSIVNQAAGSMLGIFNLFSGGNFAAMTIFALGIMPYITSSIILQLMTVVFPYLERLQKEGELGRRKITQYTRYLTIVLSVIQSSTIATALQSQSLGGQSLVYRPGYSFVLIDHPHADDRLRFHHVAGRADQRARHRQWHVAHHLHRHCGGLAARGAGLV